MQEPRRNPHFFTAIAHAHILHERKLLDSRRSAVVDGTLYLSLNIRSIAEKVINLVHESGVTPENRKRPGFFCFLNTIVLREKIYACFTLALTVH